MDQTCTGRAPQRKGTKHGFFIARFYYQLITERRRSLSNCPHPGFAHGQLCDPWKEAGINDCHGLRSTIFFLLHPYSPNYIMYNWARAGPVTETSFGSISGKDPLKEVCKRRFRLVYHQIPRIAFSIMLEACLKTRRRIASTPPSIPPATRSSSVAYQEPK
jgi:hypothetical protein